MAKITLLNINKTYQGQCVVQDFSLEVEDGRFAVLVGPSGCGKTTLLRMIAGLESVDQGEIYIADRKVNHLAPKDRDIAMVFQSYALYPHMDVYHNLAFGLSLRGMGKKEIAARVHQAAELLGIGDKLKSKPGQLSGGQRQRVALGRAMVRQPQVFLFDEPLSNLDAKLRVQMRAELAQLHRRLHTTTIYVTHDQVEAMTLADNIAVIRDGTLQQYASPREIYGTPSNLFVAGFIGSPSMNFIPARARSGDGCLRLTAKGLTICLPAPDKCSWPSQVIVGIRPDALSGPVAGNTDNQVTVEVVLSENMGHSQLIHGRCGDHPIVAVQATDRVFSKGDTAHFQVQAESVYIFDPISGLNIDELVKSRVSDGVVRSSDPL